MVIGHVDSGAEAHSASSGLGAGVGGGCCSDVERVVARVEGVVHSRLRDCAAVGSLSCCDVVGHA